MKNNTLLIIGINLCFCAQLFAQASKMIDAPLFYPSLEGQTVIFRIVKEPYLQPATNADPYFSYYWEFGDGHFSRDKSVTKHTYAKSGKYTAKLYLTPCGSIDFVNGASAALVEIPVNAVGTPTENDLANNERLNVQTNHNLRAGENMVATLSYRGSGTLILFYNEKKVSKKEQLLRIKETRIYNGERKTETTDALNKQPDVKKIGEGFMNKIVFDVPQGDPSPMESFRTVKNVFIEFDKVLENRILIGKFLNFKAVFISGSSVLQKELNLKLEQSHDPNDIDVSPHYPSFRNIEKKAFDYTVRFQNVGDGIEPSVFVTTLRPRGISKDTFKLLDWSPKCKPCAEDYTPQYRDTVQCLKTLLSGDSVVFRFYGINLRGTKQAGVEDKSLTKGFVKYQLYPKKGMVKQDFTARAYIDFGGVVKKTNLSEVEFLPGLTIGAKFGINYNPETSTGNTFIGVTFSPYKSFGPYLQFEAQLDVTPQKRTNTVVVNRIARIRIDTQNCADCYRDSFSEFHGTITQRGLSFVPAQVRWDLSKVLSIGLGGSADLFLRTVKGTDFIEVKKVLPFNCYWTLLRTEPAVYDKTTVEYRFNAFGDIEIGTDKLKLGGRYVIPFLAGQEDNRRAFVQIYTIYKF